jgi:hypothetical protein
MRKLLIGLAILVACGGSPDAATVNEPPTAVPLPQPQPTVLDPTLVYVSQPTSIALHFYTFAGAGRWLRYVLGGQPMQIVRVETVQPPALATAADLKRLAGTMLVRVGAWEYAITMGGDNDFVGNRHGFDAPTAAYSLSTPLELGETKGFPSVTLTHESIVSDRSTNTQRARANRTYRFFPDRLEIDIALTWLTDTHVRVAYVAMCPLLRGSGYPDRAQLVNDDVVQDVSVGGFATRHMDSPGVRYWTADGMGPAVTFEILNADEALDGYRTNSPMKSWIEDGVTPQYNKFYATRVGSLTAVKQGEVWPVRTRFSVKYE